MELKFLSMDIKPFHDLISDHLSRLTSHPLLLAWCTPHLFLSHTFLYFGSHSLQTWFGQHHIPSLVLVPVKPYSFTCVFVPSSCFTDQNLASICTPEQAYWRQTLLCFWFCTSLLVQSKHPSHTAVEKEFEMEVSLNSHCSEGHSRWDQLLDTHIFFCF